MQKNQISNANNAWLLILINPLHNDEQNEPFLIGNTNTSKPASAQQNSVAPCTLVNNKDIQSQIYLYSTFNRRHCLRAALEEPRFRFRCLMNKPEATKPRKTSHTLHEEEASELGREIVNHNFIYYEV